MGGRAPRRARRRAPKVCTESFKTSGEKDNGNKKSEKDSATVENKKKAHKLYMRFW